MAITIERNILPSRKTEGEEMMMNIRSLSHAHHYFKQKTTANNSSDEHATLASVSAAARVRETSERDVRRAGPRTFERKICRVKFVNATDPLTDFFKDPVYGKNLFTVAFRADFFLSISNPSPSTVGRAARWGAQELVPTPCVVEKLT